MPRQLLSLRLAAVLLLATPLCAEVPPDSSRPCFPGAGYRKAVSSHDNWTGIDTIVTLPTPQYDPERLRSTGRPLDNASVYIGGHAGKQEVDCGLSWDVIREPDDKVSSNPKAFRIFWRVSNWNSGPARPEYYFYPGDTVRMVCRTTGKPDELEMQIDLLHRADDPTTSVIQGERGERTVWAPYNAEVAAAAQNQAWTTSTSELLTQHAPLSTFRTTFRAPGFGPGEPMEFKRVNGLDQSGNEGRPAQPTNTKITGAVWRQVHLLRGPDHEPVPMSPSRFTDMRCPGPETVVVTPQGETGERVDLMGIRK